MRRFTIATLALAAAATPAAGQVTSYTTRSDFTAASSALTVQDFGGITSDTSFRNTPLAFTGFSIVGTGAAQGSQNFVDVSPLVYPQASNGASPYAEIILASTGANLSIVTLTFSSAITAFGADFFELNDSSTQKSQIALGSQVVVPSAVTGSGNGFRFLGFVSATPFTTVTFSALQNRIDAFAMDNVTFGAANAVTPVPEPATWAMMIAGFGMVGGSLRRRRATPAAA